MRNYFLAFIFVVISFLGASTSAHAASLTEEQIQAIISLLKSFNAEPTAVDNVTTSLHGGTPSVVTETAVPTEATPVSVPSPAPLPSTPAASPAQSVSPIITPIATDVAESLPAFERALRPGTSGDDVGRLQKFLSQYPDIYPEKRITGFFGPQTQRALERFQVKNTIVSSGKPETTGYGALGPKTRAKINELLTEGAGNSGIIPPGLLRAPGISGETPPPSVAPTPTTPAAQTQTTATSPTATPTITTATTPTTSTTGTVSGTNPSIQQITTNTASQYNPEVSGNTVVWIDTRNSGTTGEDIYAYDISTNIEKVITNAKYNQGEPSVSSNRIVWDDNRYDGVMRQIYTYDLFTGLSKQITPVGVDRFDPDISGDKVVYTGISNNGYDNIFMHDFSTGKETQITNANARQWHPKIDGTRIVWEDSRNGNPDIYEYDLSTGQERRITTDTKFQWNPDISGNIIVWQDYRDYTLGASVPQIYMYDLTTGKETRITQGQFTRRDPRIDGNTIVWTDLRNNGIEDIYAYDIPTGQETRVTSDSNSQFKPAISGTKIVWYEWVVCCGGDSNIYMATLGTNTPSTATSTTQTTTGSGSTSGTVTTTATTPTTTTTPPPTTTTATTTTSTADTASPSTPTGLSATAVSSSQINLSWSASTDNVGVTGYKIYRDMGDSSLITSVTGTSYSVTGLTAGLPYVFYVSAYDAAGNVSSKTASPSATTQTAGTATTTTSGDTTAPSTPTSLTATAVSSSQINLTWSASTDNVGVAGYKIYRDMGDSSLITSVTGTSYSVTGLTANIAYIFYVSAYDAAGNVSSKAAFPSATTQGGSVVDTTPPSTPTGLTATAVSSSQINVSWSPSTDNVGVTGYKVYRETALIASSVTTTSYSDTGLSAGTTYIYVIVAYDAAGNVSLQKATAGTTNTATTDTTPPVISNVQATNIAINNATITWTTDEAADSKAVLMGQNTVTFTDTAKVTNHSIAATNLVGGQRYSYTVSSADTAGNTQTSSSQVLTMLTPGAATMVSCTDTDGGINFGTYGSVTVSYSTGGSTRYSDGCYTYAGINKDAEYFCEGTSWKRTEAQCVAGCSNTTSGGICPIAQTNTQTNKIASIQINISAAVAKSNSLFDTLLQKIKMSLR